MDLILKYFPDLSALQKKQFEQLLPLYLAWNAQINVVSRKDIEQLYLKHVLHSLAIAKYAHFLPGTSILDVGTGGGFPGIPLAIFYPELQFTLIDSIGKKIKVVQAVIDELTLQNCQGIHENVIHYKEKHDFIVSRAVTEFKKFLPMVEKNISSSELNIIENGIIYLKGGDLKHELAPFKKKLNLVNISSYFEEDFFDSKKIVHWKRQ